MASGGYRKPTNPAPVSGPGELSRRTDGKQPVMDIPAQNYGDAQDLQQIQAGAPMAQVPSGPPPATPAGGTGGSPSPVVPFNAPTQNPGEPVTSGAALGPGPGPESLGIGSPVQANWQNARDVVQSMAANPGASPALQQLAERIKGAF
jgi:hypothetical protein